MFVSSRRTQTWRLHTALLQITQEWKTADICFLEGLFIYQSSIVSQTLDLIHWMATILSFDHATGENREFSFLVPIFSYANSTGIAIFRAALQPYIDDAGRKYYYFMYWSYFLVYSEIKFHPKPSINISAVSPPKTFGYLSRYCAYSHVTRHVINQNDSTITE